MKDHTNLRRTTHQGTTHVTRPHMRHNKIHQQTTTNNNNYTKTIRKKPKRLQ